MWPTPASRAWRGVQLVMSLPRRRTWPEATGRSPLIASISSLCPLPSMPATATISPAQTCSETPSTAGSPRSSIDVDVLELQQRLAGRARLLLDAQHDVAADHHPRQRRLVGAGGLDRADRLAAPQHGDAVGDLEHLVQLVRDEDDRGPVVAQPAQHLGQLGGLLRGQDRGRLVEDEDARAAIQRAQDLHALLLADRDVGYARVGIDAQAMLL